MQVFDTIVVVLCLSVLWVCSVGCVMHFVVERPEFVVSSLLCRLAVGPKLSMFHFCRLDFVKTVVYCALFTISEYF